MHYLKTLLLSLSLLILSSCGEKAADLSKPQTFTSSNCSFKYPANWNITEKHSDKSVTVVLIETTGDSLAIVQAYNYLTQQDFEDMAKEFADEATANTPVGEISTEGFSEISELNSFKRLEENFNIKLLGQDVPHKRYFARKIIGQKEFVLIFQAPKTDLSKVAPGFDFMTESFKSID